MMFKCYNSTHFWWLKTTPRKGESVPAWEGTGTRRRVAKTTQGAAAGGFHEFVPWVLSREVGRFDLILTENHGEFGIIGDFRGDFRGDLVIF